MRAGARSLRGESHHEAARPKYAPKRWTMIEPPTSELPISLTRMFSLTAKKMISEQQRGFTAGKSTGHNLVDFMEMMDKNEGWTNEGFVNFMDHRFEDIIDPRILNKYLELCIEHQDYAKIDRLINA